MSLNTWKYIYSLRKEIFLQDGANFRSNTVTKPGSGHSGYYYVSNEWYGHSFHWQPLGLLYRLNSLLKSSTFRNVKNAKNWPILLSSLTQTFGTFFSNSFHSKMKDDIDMKPRPKWSLEYQIFITWKRLIDITLSILAHFWDIPVWKLAPSCRRKIQDVFPCQAMFPWFVLPGYCHSTWWSSELDSGLAKVFWLLCWDFCGEVRWPLGPLSKAQQSLWCDGVEPGTPLRRFFVHPLRNYVHPWHA